MLWLAVFTLFVGLACSLANQLWNRFDKKFIQNEIINANFVIDSVPFPSVTICPKMYMNQASDKYIQGFLKQDSKKNMSEIKSNLRKVLSKLYNMNLHKIGLRLQNLDQYSDSLRELSIHDFLNKMLPKCHEVLEKCFWLGEELSCCSLFHLQRMEVGFCYAFNSLTSDTNREGLKAHGLHYMRAANRGLGLRVILKRNDNQKEQVPFQKFDSVIINPPDEIPDLKNAIKIQRNPGSSMRIDVSPQILQSSVEVQSLAPQVRGCLFGHEYKLKIATQYSAQCCYLQCRLLLIQKNCQCELQIFTNVSALSNCKFNHLMCIFNLTNDLFKFSSLEAESYSDSACTCYQNCNTTTYDIAITRTHGVFFKTHPHNGLLDIHFSHISSVLYEKKLSFTTSNLVEYFGGVANLCLGCSIISIFEILYFSARILIYILFNTYKKFITYKGTVKIYVKE